MKLNPKTLAVKKAMKDKELGFSDLCIKELKIYYMKLIKLQTQNKIIIIKLKNYD